MKNKILVHIFGIVLVAIVQTGMLPTWSSPVDTLNLMLCVVTLVVIMHPTHIALLWALLGGILLDIYSALPFGTITISLSVAVMVTRYLFQNFLTTFSFYSVSALSIASSLSAGVVVAASERILQDTATRALEPSFWSAYISFVFWQTILQLIMMYVLVLILHKITKSFSLRTIRPLG